MVSTKIINILRTDTLDDVVDVFKNSDAKDFIFVLPKKGKALNNENQFGLLAAVSNSENKKVSILTQDPAVATLAVNAGFKVLVTNKPAGSVSKAKLVSTKDKDEEPDTNDEPEEIEKSEIGNDDDEPKEDDMEDEEDEDSYKAEDKSHKINDYDEENHHFDEDSSIIPGFGDHNEELGGSKEERYLSELERVSSTDPYQIITALKTNKIIQDIVKPPGKDSVNLKINKETEKKFPVEVQTPPEPEPQPIPQSRFSQKDFDELKKGWPSRKDVWSDKARGKKPSLPKFKLKFGSFNSAKLTGRLIWILAGIALVSLGTVIYLSTGSAKILLQPKSHDLSATLKVRLSSKYSAVDTKNGQVPGQIFSVDGTAEDNFQATGERDVAQKARGEITVYNAYGTAPQTLIATTRFESEKGLIFRTLKAVTVPGTRVVNGEISPGSVKVEVVADKAGAEYNILPGKFTIPAFKERGDLDRYGKVYGQSTAPMSEGALGRSKVVVEKDFNDARSKVEAMARENAGKNLESKSMGLEIITLPNSEKIESNSNVKIDQAATAFNFTSKATVLALGFKRDDMLLIINNYLRGKDNLMTLSGKVSLDFSNLNFNQETGVLEADLKINGTAYNIVDQDKIVSDLMGKNEKDIRAYVKGVAGLTSAKVVLDPFWVRKIPKNKEKIQVELEYK